MGTNQKGVRRVRRELSAELKAEAVQLVAERRAAEASFTQVGRELDVRPDQLRVWIQQQLAALGSDAPRLEETSEQESR